MSKDEIVIISFALLLILVLIGVFIMMIYSSLKYYRLKPKFRINKETHLVEYWHPLYNCWWTLCGWDSEDSNRKVVLHLSGNCLEFNYKGPGRYEHKIEGKLTQKQLRERFPYKNTKELHEQQIEYINNEDIITSKIIHDKFKLINN